MTAQSRGPGELWFRGQDGRFPAAELVVHQLTQSAIQHGKIVGFADTLTIGWIADQQTPGHGAMSGAADLAQRLDGHAHDPRKPRGRDVLLRPPDNARVRIVATNLRRRPLRRTLGPGSRFGANGVPLFGLVPLPAHEAKALALKRRSPIQCHQGAFEKQRRRPAEGVDERRTFPRQGGPAGAQQHGGGEVFLQRSGAGTAAVATSVQALPRHVQRDIGLFIAQAHADRDVRRPGAHGRKTQTSGAKAIEDGIFTALGAKACIAYLCIAAAEGDGKARIGCKQ